MEPTVIEKADKIHIINTGKGRIDVEEAFGAVDNKKINDQLNQIKQEHTMHKNFSKNLDAVYADFVKRGKIDKKTNEWNQNQCLAKGSVRDLTRWSVTHPNMYMEVADNGARKIYKRGNNYNAHNPYLQTECAEVSVTGTAEFAEDDRVLGIPYAQAMAGDRVYIINGKVFTGWALYFSLSSIKSPEDYALNVDYVYNIPYLFSSILLKAQLGLGVGFDVNYGSEDLEVPEEQVIRKYLHKDLNINTQKLVKTGFHLYSYGNAYWALRKDAKTGLANKITLLQPERLKIFLDPMTTKIMFYIYLPPVIGGTTIASYPSDGRYNPNILSGVTLSYPTPIVMHPEDIIHFKINDFTEYPFGFSDVKSCQDPCSARLDVNILAPIIFKKYTKPMIHWTLDTEGIPAKQVEAKKDEMVTLLQNMEPGSDPVTTERWKADTIDVGANKNDIFTLAADMDTQIFAATGAPETYFKPKGSTDRMISEQDKTFISRMKIPQSIVGEAIENQLIKPKIDYELGLKKDVKKKMGVTDAMEEMLLQKQSYMADTPKYPEVTWNEIFKQDETQAIANSIALLNSGVIDKSRAAVKVGEKPIPQQLVEDKNKEGLDDPIKKNELNDPFAKYMIDPFENYKAPEEEGGTPDDFQTRDNMELMRGGLNVSGKKDESNRNVNDVKDPSLLGMSRHGNRNLTVADDVVDSDTHIMLIKYKSSSGESLKKYEEFADSYVERDDCEILIKNKPEKDIIEISDMKISIREDGSLKAYQEFADSFIEADNYEILIERKGEEK